MTPHYHRISAYAKINLALVVGPQRDDGLHELASVMQRVGLADDVELEEGLPGVVGFAEDTIVRHSLELFASHVRTKPAWRIRLRKRIPLAAGLGGGSADAAAALLLANGTLPRPLPKVELHALAAAVGADVPFFLEPGPKLAEGAGERLTSLRLPQEYTVLLALPTGEAKVSTGAVYARFDELGGPRGFEGRRSALRAALARCARPRDLEHLPPNDLACAAGGGGALPAWLRERGAFRADVSGAGPTVYGLFAALEDANLAAAHLRARARVWVVSPVW